jgi:hypothetical protein
MQHKIAIPRLGEAHVNLETFEWTCSCCGKSMIGLPQAFAFKAPDHWLNGFEEKDTNASHLSDDFCVVHDIKGETARYIRCVLPMQLSGFENLEFGFGVWMSVSERSWDIYRDGFESGQYAEEGCFGYLGNSIPGYPGSLHLPCDVYFQPDRQRPRIVIHECENTLAIDQMNGMKIDFIETLVTRSEH